MENTAQRYSLTEIAQVIDADILHCPDPDKTFLESLASLDTAQPGQLTFLSNPKFAGRVASSKAGAIIVSEKFADNSPVPLLKVVNPYFAYAQVSGLFSTSPSTQGVHPSAVVDESAQLGEGVSIGPNAVVAAGAVIGDGSCIGAGSVIEQGAVLGKGCQLAAKVVLNHYCVLGDRVLLHSGVIIGADGFGFAPNPKQGGWQKIHQLGRVLIGSDVEIGANTTVDRGAIDDTEIADGVIIDNQVQIAHNVKIGQNTAIAACTGIAGSTQIGANCTIAGAVGIVGHLTITDNVHVTAMSLVTGSIFEPGSYSGGTGISSTKEWKKNAVRFGQLDSIAKRLRELEKNT